MPISRPEHWTRYLRNYTLTSFGKIFPENYDGAILEFWQEQLTGDLAEIVDVGCGNGALCWIANDILNNAEVRVRITGVDFADIDPFRSVRRDRGDYPGVGFIGNTPAEQMPFADDSIDLVISQYGVEYSDLNRSIPEIARILKPSGRMSFILHDAQSAVVRLATQHLADMQTVWGFGVHELALRLFDLKLEFRTPEQRQASKEYVALIVQLNELTGRIREIVQGYASKSPIHRYMNQLMAVFADPDTASNPAFRQAIIGIGERLRSHINRIEHLKVAALDEDRRRDLVHLVESSGCSVTALETFVYSPEVRIGTAFVAEKIGKAAE